eukprot:PRCOL_00003154-RA
MSRQQLSNQSAAVRLSGRRAHTARLRTAGQRGAPVRGDGDSPVRADVCRPHMRPYPLNPM